MSAKFPFDHYLDILSRRKWIVAGILVFALVVAWITCLVTPKVYKSTTVIAVEQQKIPENYVKGIVSGLPQERLGTIQQFILSRTLLARVIEQFHLVPPAGGAGGLDSVVDGMRTKISISTIRDTIFTISFKHGDPVMAQKITATLASAFIEETTRIREQLVQSANEFLESELEKAKAELETREKAISEFKRDNMGELPQQMEANLRALDRLQLQLLSHNDALANRNDRLAMIEKAIKEYETNGVLSPEATSVAAKREVGPRALRVRELQQQLEKLQASYKDTYPDVVHLKEELKKLQTMSEEMTSESAQTQASVSKKTIDPYLHELQRQRDELKLDLDALKDKTARVAKEIKEYEIRVERAPAQEQKLQILTRDYDSMQRNFQALVEKKLNARVSENLERRQKGEQFRIIDPANLPSKPDSPDQVNIMLFGLLLGCGGGVGVALFLEHLAGVIRRSEDAEVLFGFPVFATIPDFKMAYEGTTNKALPHLSPSAEQGTAPSRPRTPSSAMEVSGVPRAKMSLLSWRKSVPRQNGSGRTNGMSAADLVKLELNLVAKWRPNSLIAEQFRVAATRLVLSNASHKGAVLVVTSAVKGEGKSSISSNLAYVLSHDLGKSTVLIDCDFKRPMLHAYNGIPAKPGLAEVIYGDLPLDSCLHQSGSAPLWILPSGRRDHRLVDLTKIPQITSIVEQLKARYDFVILDAPPILPLADMNLLAAMADSLVLVIRSGATPHELVQKALKTLRLRGGAGIILTGHDVQKVPGYLEEYYLAGQGRHN